MATDFVHDSKLYNETISLFLILLTFGFYTTFDIIATVKRFHDLNKDGTHYFYLLIPIYNLIISLELLFEKGTSGDNNFGANPRLGDGDFKKSKTYINLILFGLLFIVVWKLIDVL